MKPLEIVHWDALWVKSMGSVERDVGQRTAHSASNEQSMSRFQSDICLRGLANHSVGGLF